MSLLYIELMIKYKNKKLIYKKPKIVIKKINFNLFYNFGVFGDEKPILLAGTDCNCGAPLCLPCSSPYCC